MSSEQNEKKFFNQKELKETGNYFFFSEDKLYSNI